MTTDSALPVVFVVDDDEAVRTAIALLMRSVSLRVETFHSAAAFLDAFDASRAGCLVLDLRMPGMSGLELQRALAARGSRLPIVFVTGHGDVPDAVQALQAGAMDFIQKPFRDHELLERVQRALEVSVTRRDDEADRETLRQRVERLTPREREVMDRVVSGQANKAVAMDLGVSERTVEIHRSRVMSKMEACSLAELVRMVLRVEDPVDRG